MAALAFIFDRLHHPYWQQAERAKFIFIQEPKEINYCGMQ
jgi:hypothetical protein